MDNLLIVVKKGNSPINSAVKSFTDEIDMLKYIELKTKAGFTCHKFNYDTSFSMESRVVQSPNQTH